MLISLSIQNIVLIEKLEIDFHSGLCALTGETGAGKSILLDSLGLALGGRSEGRLLRKGADQASVTAMFQVPPAHIAFQILKKADIVVNEDEELILRRSLNQDGRTKAYINDQPVSAGVLREVGTALIEVHGQFDTQGLLNSSNHRQMLDDYAGVSSHISNLWNDLQHCHGALAQLRENAEASRAEESFLRTALEDLDSLSPQENEEKELASLRDRLMNREQVLEGLNTAYQTLEGENDPVRSAWAVLDKIADKIGPQSLGAIGALDRASSEVQEAISEIQRLSADLQASEHDLHTIDDRLFALRAQARKHGCEVGEIPKMREELAQKLNAIEHADDLLADAIGNVEKAKQAYFSEAEKLSDKRKKSAKNLDELVALELPPLKLDKAKFVTKITRREEDEWGPHGIDQVQFLVATNPGSEPGPINKIASGGEMSRFMLALKVVMAEVGSAGSLIFDEVDAGIGGSTADAVGERLSRLANDKQVMVVTHAPQVAARAAHHWIVKKGGTDNIRTDVQPLAAGQPRREEIARMLAGATITEEARAAADKLLETGKAA